MQVNVRGMQKTWTTHDPQPVELHQSSSMELGIQNHDLPLYPIYYSTQISSS
ncbi:hypothetical protein TRIATDRAFT_298856 [Trichoderma atroviride IMI 206040]|uniref:Uncharacterized protein n=1 Tax=Hypocrea atroviridis (strain ATCC 20476 / IMI 206040) TaxID=452589 RepID=G9NR83_HYPAI|nr:uncharacterized protein TRIATDRAFT_298856 [Trichoderma atroviride IMI 206040]EHK47051.1 hypothetical protein TRIATDRAFT_298856 [Trichoderma atroviride IMI 206040]